MTGVIIFVLDFIYLFIFFVMARKMGPLPRKCSGYATDLSWCSYFILTVVMTLAVKGRQPNNYGIICYATENKMKSKCLFYWESELTDVTSFCAKNYSTCSDIWSKIAWKVEW